MVLLQIDLIFYMSYFIRIEKEAGTKQKSSFFLLKENDDFCIYEIDFRSEGRFPRARLQLNCFSRGPAKKMDFPLVLFPQELPLHYNQFIKYQIFNMAIYHKQRNLYLCLSLFFVLSFIYSL